MKRCRFEVWDRANSTRLANLGTTGTAGCPIVSAVHQRAIGREETLVVDLVGASVPAAELVRAAVLRVQPHGEASGFSLWRLTGYRQSRQEDNGLQFRFEADALWMDLAHGRVRQEMADGAVLLEFGLVGLTPQQWLDSVILPGYDGDGIDFAVGVVERTEPVDLTFDHPTSPLEAARMLEQVSGGELNFRLSSDGTVYLVDLLDRVGAASGTELRYGRNLLGVERFDNDAEPVSRIYARGSGALTLADAVWPIAAVSGSGASRVVSFEKSPVFEDNAFVFATPYYLRIEGKGSYPITASDADAGTVTVTITGNPALAAGDEAAITTTLAGARLAHLESPSARETFGVRTGGLPDATDIPDARNAVANADLAEWTGALPVGWTALGSPAVSKSTDPVYARHGGAAAHIVAAADGVGLISDAFPILSDTRRPYTGMLAGLTVTTGSVRIELRHSNGITYPTQEQTGSQGLGVYINPAAHPVSDQPLPPGTAQIAIVAHGAAADWYLDTAMVTPQIGGEVPAFVRDQGAWILWDRAVRELVERSQEVREYQVAAADLFAIDAARYPHDALELGDDINVRDPDFDLETLRIVEMSQELVSGGARVSVAVSPFARPSVTDEDAARPRYRPRRPTAPPVSVPPPPSSMGPGGSVVPYLDHGAGTGSASVSGDDSINSFRILGSATGVPSAAAVRAAPAINLRIATPTEIGNLVTGLTSPSTFRVAVLFYTGPGGTGTESELVPASARFGVGAIGLMTGSVLEEKLANDAVTRNKILNGAINDLKIADLAITGAKLALAAVSTAHIVDGALTEVKIATAAITNSKMAESSISTGKLQALAITAEKVAAGAIVAGKIAAGAINATNLIANGIITGDLIATGTITGAKIVALSITASNLAALTISGDKISANAITSDKIFVSLLSAISGNVGELTAGIIRNAANTTGIVISGAADPAWTSYISLLPAGGWFLYSRTAGGYETLKIGHTGEIIMAGDLILDSSLANRIVFKSGGSEFADLRAYDAGLGVAGFRFLFTGDASATFWVTKSGAHRGVEVNGQLSIWSGNYLDFGNGWRMRGHTNGNLDWDSLGTNRMWLSTAGNLNIDGAYNTFSPTPPKPAEEMAGSDWLEWALADACKPHKPYSGAPTAHNPEVIAEAARLKKGRAWVAARDEARYGKDISKIAIGTARWAETAHPEILRLRAEVDALKQQLAAVA